MEMFHSDPVRENERAASASNVIQFDWATRVVARDGVENGARLFALALSCRLDADPTRDLALRLCASEHALLRIEGARGLGQLVRFSEAPPCPRSRAVLDRLTSDGDARVRRTAYAVTRDIEALVNQG